MSLPKAMILAAGRGARMRPLTDHTPKPLLEVAGKPLMQWPMEALAAAGCGGLLINTAWLGEQIARRFGPVFTPARGAPLSIAYSDEARDFGGALETAGGVLRLLDPLGALFWVVAGDIFAPEFGFSADSVARFAASGRLAHLWLVPNPPQHPRGDFCLTPDGLAKAPTAPEVQGAQTFTFSGIGLYRRGLFEAPYCSVPPGNPAGTRLPLAPLLLAAMADGRIGAELFTGRWHDVGTPERLAALNAVAGH